MARFLALDLEQRQVRLLGVSAGRGGSPIDQAFSFTFAEDLTPSSGEALGKVLREALRQAGIAPAPILASVGRDRVIFKEVRFPAVAPHEEPALVRFQASKELTEPVSEVVIDYLVLSEPAAPPPRLAMAMVLRRELVQALNALGRGLGQKVMGIVPRPLAMEAAFERVSGGPSRAAIAVLNLSERWAELCVLQDGKPRFARSLVNSAGVIPDVKRSLTLYAAQAGEAGAPQALYLAGTPTPDVREAWRAALGLKVEALDPFGPTDKALPPGERGAYFAAAGVAQLAASFPKWPVNFARPKEGGPAPKKGRRERVLYGAIAAGAALLLLVLGIIYLSWRRGEVSDLRGQEAELDEKIKKLSVDKPAVDSLKDWQFGEVSWDDELFDIAAAFPQEKGLRVMQLSAQTLPRKSVTDKISGRITLRVVAPAGKRKLVDQFIDSITKSPRGDTKGKVKKDSLPVRATLERYRPLGADQGDEYSIKIEVERQAPPQYHAALPPLRVPTKAEMTPVPKAEEPDALEDFIP